MIKNKLIYYKELINKVKSLKKKMMKKIIKNYMKIILNKTIIKV